MQCTIDQHADGGGHGSVDQEVALFIVCLCADKHSRQLAHGLLILQVRRARQEPAMHTLHVAAITNMTLNYHVL